MCGPFCAFSPPKDEEEEEKGEEEENDLKRQRDVANPCALPHSKAR